MRKIRLKIIGFVINMSKYSLFSFFSGSGFLDLGFEKNGFDVQFVNEFHKPFLEAYSYTRKKLNINEPLYGYNNQSIEEFLTGDGKKYLSSIVLGSKKSSDLVGFIGGPPCPDFSVGGKNRGREGDNGKLTETYITAIIQQKPDFFIFENVKGLWRTKKHRSFYDEMKGKLEKNGYVLTDRLTNSIEYGVAQDRDRIFLFGIQKKLVKKKLSSHTLSDLFNWEKYISHDRSIVLDQTNWPTLEEYKPEEYKPIPEHIKNYAELTVEHWFKRNNVNNHPNSEKFFTPRAGLAKFKTIMEGDTNKKSYKRLHRWRYSPTAAYGNNEVHLHPYKSRRLSAAEALAIQSLPKEFHFPPEMTLSNMFKTIGNGVPYLAASGLAKTVYHFLEDLE